MSYRTPQAMQFNEGLYEAKICSAGFKWGGMGQEVSDIPMLKHSVTIFLCHMYVVQHILRLMIM